MSGDRHCEPAGRANARPMTGSAKQSILPLRGEMDCFAALAMTTSARIRATRSLAMTVQLFEKLNRPHHPNVRRRMRPAPTNLFRGLNPFRRTAPQRVAMFGAEKTEMADLGGARVSGGDGQDVRPGRRKPRTKKFNRRLRGPRIIGKAQRASPREIAENSAKS